MWYCVSDLVSCPGLPGSYQAIARKADREDWVCRDRKGQGGGKEYHFDSLPTETQVYLKRQQSESVRKKIADLIEKPLSVSEMSNAYWKAEFEGLEDNQLPSFGCLLEGGV